MNTNRTLPCLFALVFVQHLVFGQYNNGLRFGLAYTNFNSWNAPFKETMNARNGGFKVSAGKQGIWHQKGISFKFGYERLLSPRFAIDADLIGVRVNSSTIYNRTVTDITGMIYSANFPRERKLWAGIAQAMVYFDFLKDERYAVQLGVGPSGMLSHFHYNSYVEFYVGDSNYSSLVEIQTTTSKAAGLGLAVALRGEIKLTDFMVLYCNIQGNWYDTYYYGMKELGVVYRY